MELIIVLTLFFLSFSICFIWKIPLLQTKNISDPKDRISIENAIRDTYIKGLGGILVFLTVYVSLQNISITQENLKVAQQNLILTQEKQVTERFSKAIEMLGNQNIHVRIGAIYALERIANDSDKDYRQVMEILTAYVRETAPYPAINVENLLLETKMSSETNIQKEIFATPIDIQAVLSVIQRRKFSIDTGKENILNLSQANLEGINLTGLDERANINRDNISLIEINNFTNLKQINLSRANLRRTNFTAINLENANLSGADLRGATLNGADLQLVDFKKADFRGANLIGADLQLADFKEADLRGVNFSGSYYEYFSKKITKLSKANLSGANLEEANLVEVEDLTPEQIKAAKNWEKAYYNPEFRKLLGLPPDPAENQRAQN